LKGANRYYNHSIQDKTAAGIMHTVFYFGGGQSMKDILDLICYVILAVYDIYEKYKK